MAGDDLYEFGPFRLEPAERRLSRDDRPVALTPKCFDLLVVLVENSNHLLSKEELLERLWPDQFVEESNLSFNISELRKLLGEGPGGAHYIETVRKKGFRFVERVDKKRGGETRPSEGEDSAVPPGNGNGKTGNRVGDDGEVGEDRSAASAKVPKRPHLRREILISVLAASALALSAYALWTKRAATSTGQTLKTIAVLPFKPLASDARDELLELGMADTLITKLGNVHAVTVRPTSAVRRYTGLEQDPVAAGRELGVEAVLDGHIQRSGGRVRVTARLVRVADGGQLWAGQFDEEFTDIFSVQDAISGQAARSLELRLSGEEERRLVRRDTQSAEAYELYLKGRYFWNKRERYGLEKAIEHFHQAIGLDPGYALAHSGLADSYALLSNFSDVAPMESFPRAKEAAERALSLDNTLAEAHTSLAYVREGFEWDFAGAEGGYRRAIDLNPNYATARHRYGVFLSLMGRFDEGLAELERARRLDPTSLIINADIGFANYLARRYDRCIDQLRRAVEMEPNFSRPHVYLVDCYVQKGMFDEAIAAARKASDLSGSADAAKTLLSYSYAAAGREGEAREILEELAAQGEERFTQPLALAATYTALGDKGRAFRLLERGYEQRAYAMLRLRADPRVDGLRSDSRFQNLLRRIVSTP